MPDLFRPTTQPTRDLESRLWSDPWLLMSALQKATRRGEVDIVHRAVVALHELRGVNTCRRLVVIAFEDIGIGQPETVADVTSLAVDAIRRKRPLSPAILMRAARALADAPKDRSADYLMSSVTHSPVLEPLREHLGSTTVANRLALVADDNLAIEDRATAAWFSSGLNIGGERRLDRGDRPALMQLYRDLGAPEQLVNAAEAAATLTREPICVFVPLIWLASRKGALKVEHPIIRRSPRVGGIPLVTAGMHTRVGRQAISAFCKTAPIRTVMEQWVPSYRARDVAFNAEFHIDGGAITPRLEWSEGARLEKLAVEIDLVHAGAMREGVAPILTAFRENITLLNDIREHLLADAFGTD